MTPSTPRSGPGNGEPEKAALVGEAPAEARAAGPAHLTRDGLARPHRFRIAARGIGARAAHFRLLATSDLHVHIHPYDYCADREVAGIGLARLATLIAAARSGAPGALLLDNGDHLQGNPMGDFVATRGEDGLVHPMIAAMNVLGYDVGTLGNHEFNYGVPFLERALADAAFPVVSANIARALASDPRDDCLLRPPYALLEREVEDGTGARRPIRIGVIGVLPPQVIHWDARHLGRDFAARDMVDAVAAWVPEMRAAGAEIIVVLCHSGIEAVPRSPGMENAALHVAAIEGVDAIVAGHQHRVFPGPDFADHPGVDRLNGRLMGRPAVMPGFWGSHLGVIDLLLEEHDGGWRVAENEAGLAPVADDGGKPIDAAPALMAAVARDHDGTLSHIRRPVGRIDAPLHSFFALLGVGPSVDLVNEAQTAFVRDRLRARPEERLPVLSASAPFKAGGRAGPEHFTHVPAGAIEIRNLADIYPFPNHLRVLEIDGTTLRAWLERSAAIFQTLGPGSGDRPLLDPDFASHNFDVVSGVEYVVDLSRPPLYDVNGVPVPGRT
ncbi:MAG: bifunctional 2',3'-cyclic-nucleotide 2'-phosphodiesterase/3'-nucleotidase, partial [Pseudomonadota bacterium]